jgi:hypothetical protein
MPHPLVLACRRHADTGKRAYDIAARLLINSALWGDWGDAWRRSSNVLSPLSADSADGKRPDTDLIGHVELLVTVPCTRTSEDDVTSCEAPGCVLEPASTFHVVSLTSTYASVVPTPEKHDPGVNARVDSPMLGDWVFVAIDATDEEVWRVQAYAYAALGVPYPAQRGPAGEAARFFNGAALGRAFRVISRAPEYSGAYAGCHAPNDRCAHCMDLYWPPAHSRAPRLNTPADMQTAIWHRVCARVGDDCRDDDDEGGKAIRSVPPSVATDAILPFVHDMFVPLAPREADALPADDKARVALGPFIAQKLAVIDSVTRWAMLQDSADPPAPPTGLETTKVPKTTVEMRGAHSVALQRAGLVPVVNNGTQCCAMTCYELVAGALVAAGILSYGDRDDATRGVVCPASVHPSVLYAAVMQLAPRRNVSVVLRESVMPASVMRTARSSYKRTGQ